jgi:hypothetical protein
MTMTTPTWAGGSTPEARPATRSPPHLRLTRRIHTRGDGNKAASITGRCAEISSIMCPELGDGGRHGEAQRQERGRHDGPELGDGGMRLWWKTVPYHTTCSSMRTVAEGATSASTASFGHGACVHVSRRWVAAAARSVEKSFFLRI